MGLLTNPQRMLAGVPQDSSIENAVRQIEGSVVRFETIGGLEKVDGQSVNTGPSTGLVVSDDGYVISAAINFSNQPTAIFARLPGGEKVPASIVGKDLSRNLVLIELNSEQKFSVPRTVSRNSLTVGQTAIAIGRVYDKSELNISTGIVSATNRIWGKAIQTDAKVSAANFGGPLLNLKGEVMGVLVPLSPSDESVAAGTEWYDSGIGFAVPLDEVMTRFDDLKSGKSLRQGLLGASLKGSDIYSDQAEIAYCSGSSPAWKSGMRPKDKIVSANGMPIVRQAQLKHALGALYENDEIEFVVERDGKQQTLTATLAGELEPYQPVAIGIVPDSSDDSKLVIRHVIQDSTAEQSGILAGDVVVSLNQEAVKTWSQTRQKLVLLNIGEDCQLEVDRNGERQTIEVSIEAQGANQEEVIPVPDVESADWQVNQIKVSDAANECFAFAPAKSKQTTSSGLIVWIPEPGQVDFERAIDAWKAECVRRNMILLMPESVDKDRWQVDEIEFVAKAIGNLAKRNEIDFARVTIGGQKSGGAMAALVANSQREFFKGLVLLDSGFPNRVKKFESSAVRPLLVFTGTSKESAGISDAAKLVLRLEASKLPYVRVEKNSSNLSSWIEEIVGWADIVNRL